MISNLRIVIILLLSVASYAQPDFESKIRSVEVTSRVTLNYCRTTILCTVDNQNFDPQRVKYSIPLPMISFISNVTVMDRGNVFTGRILSENDIPGNEDRESNWTIPNIMVKSISLYDSRVYLISMLVNPFSKVTFNLTYEHPITRELGEYIIPINVFLNEAIPKFKVEVILNETSPLKFIKVFDFYERTLEDLQKINSSAKLFWYSPSLNYARVVWTPSEEEQKKLSSNNRQFQVKYDTYPEDRILRSKDGSFMHKFTKDNFNPLKKHVTFVLDVSESMEGQKIRQLKKAMHGILDMLSEKDKFSLIFYSSKMKVWNGSGTCSTLTDSSVNVTSDVIRESNIRNINRAKGCVTQLTSGGGTFTFEALVKGFNISRLVKTLNPDTNLLMILLTDGKPNGIISNKTEIVRRVTEMNKSLNVSLYSLGFGNEVDFSFLKTLSLKNRGSARNIYDTDDAADQMKKFYKSVSSLLLSNIRFEYEDTQVNTSTLSNTEFYNYFNGTSMMTFGETQKKLTKPLSVKLNSDQMSLEQTEIFPVDDETSHYLKRHSNYMRIQDLMEKGDARSKREAVDLAKLYNFAIPSTYMVVQKLQDGQFGEPMMII